jgi:hypothetical protein
MNYRCVALPFEFVQPIFQQSNAALQVEVAFPLAADRNFEGRCFEMDQMKTIGQMA